MSKAEEQILLRVVMTRQHDGRWEVLRERRSTGERFGAQKDLRECLETVLAAYDEKGLPR